MATNNKLKAYVRFDGTGRVIAGSLILQRFKPKVGNWKEIDANECCNPPDCTTYIAETVESAGVLSYTDCFGEIIGPINMDPAQQLEFCARTGTIAITEGITITTGGACYPTTTSTTTGPR